MPDNRKRGFLILAQHDHSLAKTLTFLEKYLDLSRLDAIAAQSDLVVGASQKVNIAIGDEARQVASAVDGAIGA
jgi:hypothetical protein